MELRHYQKKAIELLYDWFGNNKEGNVCLNLPTGSGKSLVLAALIKDALTNWPELRVLMLVHSRELIVQNAEKMRALWRGAPMGIYSASLKRKNLSEPITFAGIQSIAKKGNELGHVDIIIVDECHAISNTETGNYRKLLSCLKEINPNVRIIGLSASPYRLGQGLITEGDQALFSEIIEPVTVAELIALGHLSPLRSKHTSYQLDASGVKKNGGEYVAAALEKAMDTAANNVSAVDETILRAADRKSWLFFCAGVEHAKHVKDLLTLRGISSACVTGETPDSERDHILREYKAGRIRAVTNVNVLTTGFDAPQTDCIVMLRPTLSPGLYVQMAGRGLRPAVGKVDCLVLDFAGNVATHGPITNVTPPGKAGKGDGIAKTKECPTCHEECALNVRTCEACGHQFPEPEKSADPVVLRNDDIMGLQPTEMIVTGWQWRKHVSRASGKEMLSVSYYGSLSDPAVSEYFPVTHDGYAGSKARGAVASIAGKAKASTTPEQLDEAASELNKGTPPALIKYFREGKFYRVAERSWL